MFDSYPREICRECFGQGFLALGEGAFVRCELCEGQGVVLQMPRIWEPEKHRPRSADL